MSHRERFRIKCIQKELVSLENDKKKRKEPSSAKRKKKRKKFFSTMLQKPEELPKNITFVRMNIERLIGFKVFIEKPIGYCMKLESCTPNNKCIASKPCSYTESSILKLRSTNELYIVLQQIRLNKYLRNVGEHQEFQVACDIFQSLANEEYFIVTKGMFLSGQRTAVGNTYLKNIYDLLKISDRKTKIVEVTYGKKGKKSMDIKFHSGLFDYSWAIFNEIIKKKIIPPNSIVNIIGHSMGSAISQILGCMLYYEYPEYMKRINVLAVGSPRVIDAEWCAMYNRNKSLQRKLRYYRVANYSEEKKYLKLNIPHLRVRCSHGKENFYKGSVDPVVTFPSHNMYGNPGKLFLIGNSRSCGNDAKKSTNLISNNFSYTVESVNTFDVSLYNLWEGFGLHFGLEKFMR